ncbi:MAG: HD-GYP domain-containing protein [Defluviitaleaceae bacterium]|nr:HD-GYP domain-containing protein [Defluviitaleaceae bacterium]
MKHSRSVLVNELKEDMELADAIYVNTGSGPPMLVARKGSFVNARLINILTKHQFKSVKIATSSPASPHQETSVPKSPLKPMLIPKPELSPQPVQKADIREILDIPAPQPTLSPNLREETISSISELFSVMSSSDENVNMTTAYQVVRGFENSLNQVLTAVTQDSAGLIQIHDLKSYDEYTYHHSLSVSLLAIATGQVLGLDDKTLKNLGRCAMLHDIGKQTIPLSITQKTGRLTDAEVAIMKLHPTNGAKVLKRKSMGNKELWGGVMCHHEKYDGTGYPMGLAGDKIPLFSRIIAVADVYDAVTSYRSYRSPMSPSAAYYLIRNEVGTAFDYDILKAFSKRLVLYPTGTFVQLSDSRIGVVVENENAMRPVVKILNTNDLIDLSNKKNVDLSILRVIESKQ